MSKKLSSIRVSNLSFQYNLEKQVLDDVSFLVSPQEKVAIMGQNGAGKSTLCQIFIGELNDYDGEVSIPVGVQIAYASQVMDKQYLHWTMQDFLLDAKGLRESLKQYFLLLELLAFDKSFDGVALQGREKKLDDHIKQFAEFLESYDLPELQVSEECAVELMCEIECMEDLDELFQQQALKFLRKCPSAEMTLNLDEFLKRFEIYFDFLTKKSELQKYAKETFSVEMMELLGDLQEQYDHVGGYEIDEQVREVLELVGLQSLDKNLRIELFSGGQKSRLIMAQAILKNPDILILDEPTNNLDVASYKRLKEFVKNFKGTLLVISHDADFLNSFVQKVLYIDSHTHKVREYSGTYENVKKEIEEQMDRERSERAKIDRDLKRKKEIFHKRSQQAQVYSKATALAASAKKMKHELEDLEKKKEGGLKEDKPISSFLVNCEVLDESLMAIDYISRWNGEEEELLHFSYQVDKSNLVLIAGENGMGKSWYLKECIAYAKLIGLEGTEVLPETIYTDIALQLDKKEAFINRLEKKVWFSSNVRLGYYSQDFSTLDYNQTVQESMEHIHPYKYEEMRSTLARFSFTEKQLSQKVGELSEGQKALLSFARLVFLEPNLLILDEPTNHINFRHLPVIQDALKKYRGTVVLVCHDEEFIKDLPFAQVLDIRDGKKWKWKKWSKEYL